VRIALAITSHERPDALAAVFASIRALRVAPDEIVIADDGSGSATQAVIASFIAASAVPAHLVTQPHEGFRVARLRNLAIAATALDYLVFIDGDMVLHPEFVADHARMARPGNYTQGVRVLADARLTTTLINNPAPMPTPFTGGAGFLRRAYLVHSPLLSSVFRRAGNGFVAVKSCNQGFWRDDLVRVNGFDEDFVGWGPEDKELCARLENSGVRRQTLLFGGIACHLHHAPASREHLPGNLARLAITRRDRRVRCEHGLDLHMR
jgi:glycosyltransferase involved in cell wall biosynthesis